MNKNVLILFLFLISCAFPIKAQEISFEDLPKKLAKQPKKIIVFTHTNWCSYCKSMEKNTFKNYKVKEIIDKDFYFIKLNAEHTKDIYFNKKKYSFHPNGIKSGIHELAYTLNNINGKISYPSIVIMNPNYQIIETYPSFLNTKNFIEILKRHLN